MLACWRARFANARWALRAQPICKVLGLIDFSNAFSAVVQHEGYGAGFFVSDLLPPSALGLSGTLF